MKRRRSEKPPVDQLLLNLRLPVNAQGTPASGTQNPDAQSQVHGDLEGAGPFDYLAVEASSGSVAHPISDAGTPSISPAFEFDLLMSARRFQDAFVLAKAQVQSLGTRGRRRHPDAAAWRRRKASAFLSLDSPAMKGAI